MPLKPREQRFKLIRGAIVHHEHGTIGARLRNISRGGALLECDEPFAVGAPLRLDISADALLDAKVVWTNGRSVGVQFATPFDLKKLGPATNRTSPPMAILPKASRQA